MADFLKFEQSIVKIDKDGNTVLSDTLYPGEKVSFTGQTFAQAKAERASRITEESSGGVTQWTQDAREPQDGNPTATLDPSKTSTVRGEYEAE